MMAVEGEGLQRCSPAGAAHRVTPSTSITTPSTRGAGSAGLREPSTTTVLPGAANASASPMDRKPQGVSGGSAVLAPHEAPSRCTSPGSSSPVGSRKGMTRTRSALSRSRGRFSTSRQSYTPQSFARASTPASPMPSTSRGMGAPRKLRRSTVPPLAPCRVTPSHSTAANTLPWSRFPAESRRSTPPQPLSKRFPSRRLPVLPERSTPKPIQPRNVLPAMRASRSPGARMPWASRSPA